MVKKLILLFFSLVFLEILLQIFTHFSPKVAYLLSREQSQWIPDKTLGFRPHPSYPEHDARGFRNKVDSRAACIVALGDSQTYGWKVQSFQAWPQRLGNLANVSVYNMAVPQYGPVHSLLLWGEAMKLKPRVVIEGFYVGNDLYDCYHMVYDQGSLPQLRSGSPVVTKTISDAGKFEFDLPSFQTERKEKHGIVRTFLAENCKLYGLFRAVRRVYHYNFVMTDEDIHFTNDWEKIQEMASSNKDYFVFDNGKVKTVLDTGNRSAALDLDDPRMNEGLRIALEVFRRMNSYSRTKGIHFMVLMIPTKELVFKEVVYSSSTNIPAAYGTMIEREERIWQETTKYLQDNQISFIEVLPVLRKALLSSEQPYSISANGHKNSPGHELVANSVLSYIEEYFRSTVESCRND